MVTDREPQGAWSPASTASDLARFLHALFRGDLLSQDSRTQMTASVAVREAHPGWRRPAYGLGLMADAESPWGALWGHNGEGPGYRASVFHAPSLGGRPVTAAAMCAAESDAAEGLVRAALDAA